MYFFCLSFFFIISGFPGGTVVKNPSVNAGDSREPGLIPGSGRSPGEGNGNPLQYSCWETPWTEEPDGLQFKGSQRVRYNWASEHIQILASEHYTIPHPFQNHCLHLPTPPQYLHHDYFTFINIHHGNAYLSTDTWINYQVDYMATKPK